MGNVCHGCCKVRNESIEVAKSKFSGKCLAEILMDPKLPSVLSRQITKWKEKGCKITVEEPNFITIESPRAKECFCMDLKDGTLRRVSAEYSL